MKIREHKHYGVGLAVSYILPYLVTAIVLIASGCTINKEVLLQTAADVTRVAVFEGTRAKLIQNGETRPAFQLAVDQLNKLLDDGTYSAVDLYETMKALPVSQFTGPSGTLYLTTVVSIYTTFTGDGVSIESKPAVKKIAEAIRDGMQLALAERVIRRMPWPQTTEKPTPRSVTRI